MAIPGNETFSSQVLNLDDVVAVVWDYYYNNKTRGKDQVLFDTWKPLLQEI
jgi:hypothetical protein